MINLDYVCAETANEIIQEFGKKGSGKYTELDTQVTSALNILAEQGIYAMFLWMREEKRGYDYIITPINKLFHLKDLPVSIQQNLPEHNACLELTASLKSMFLAQKLIEQVLTYARHMAKARKE